MACGNWPTPGSVAVVLYSLFEEQLRRQAALDSELAAGAERFPEALSYFPELAEEEPGPRVYLSLLERAVAAVDVPVIASLNGVTPGGWVDYARAMQDAGAAAIELNIYYLPGHAHTSGRDVEHARKLRQRTARSQQQRLRFVVTSGPGAAEARAGARGASRCGRAFRLVVVKSHEP